MCMIVVLIFQGNEYSIVICWDTYDIQFVNQINLSAMPVELWLKERYLYVDNL